MLIRAFSSVHSRAAMHQGDIFIPRSMYFMLLCTNPWRQREVRWKKIHIFLSILTDGASARKYPPHFHGSSIHPSLLPAPPGSAELRGGAYRRCVPLRGATVRKQWDSRPPIHEWDTISVQHHTHRHAITITKKRNTLLLNQDVSEQQPQLFIRLWLEKASWLMGIHTATTQRDQFAPLSKCPAVKTTCVQLSLACAEKWIIEVYCS